MTTEQGPMHGPPNPDDPVSLAARQDKPAVVLAEMDLDGEVTGYSHYNIPGFPGRFLILAEPEVRDQVGAKEAIRALISSIRRSGGCFGSLH